MFYYTNSIWEAINVMGENTNYKTVRFLSNDEFKTWKYEMDIHNMRKEVKIDPHRKPTDVEALDYVISQLEEKDIPKPMLKLVELKNEAQGRVNKFCRTMTDLTLKRDKHQKPYIVSFANKHFPELKITKRMKVENIIKKILK